MDLGVRAPWAPTWVHPWPHISCAKHIRPASHKQVGPTQYDVIRVGLSCVKRIMCLMHELWGPPACERQTSCVWCMRDQLVSHHIVWGPPTYEKQVLCVWRMRCGAKDEPKLGPGPPRSIFKIFFLYSYYISDGRKKE